MLYDLSLGFLAIFIAPLGLFEYWAPLLEAYPLEGNKVKRLLGYVDFFVRDGPLSHNSTYDVINHTRTTYKDKLIIK